jgi:hypothetical protein
MSRLTTQSNPLVSPDTLQFNTNPTPRRVFGASPAVDDTARQLLSVIQSAGQAVGTYNQFQENRNREAARREYESATAEILEASVELNSLDPNAEGFGDAAAGLQHRIVNLYNGYDFEGTDFAADWQRTAGGISAQANQALSRHAETVRARAASGISLEVDGIVADTTARMIADPEIQQELLAEFTESGLDGTEFRTARVAYMNELLSEQRERMQALGPEYVERLDASIYEHASKLLINTARAAGAEAALADKQLTQQVQRMASRLAIADPSRSFDQILGSVRRQEGGDTLQISRTEAYEELGNSILARMSSNDLTDQELVGMYLRAQETVEAGVSQRTEASLRAAAEEIQQRQARRIVERIQEYPLSSNLAESNQRIVKNAVGVLEMASLPLLRPEQREIVLNQDTWEGKLNALSNFENTQSLASHFSRVWLNGTFKNTRSSNAVQEKASSILNQYTGNTRQKRVGDTLSGAMYDNEPATIMVLQNADKFAQNPQTIEMSNQALAAYEEAVRLRAQNGPNSPDTIQAYTRFSQLVHMIDGAEEDPRQLGVMDRELLKIPSTENLQRAVFHMQGMGAFEKFEYRDQLDSEGGEIGNLAQALYNYSTNPDLQNLDPTNAEDMFRIAESIKSNAESYALSADLDINGSDLTKAFSKARVSVDVPTNEDGQTLGEARRLPLSETSIVKMRNLVRPPVGTEDPAEIGQFFEREVRRNGYGFYENQNGKAELILDPQRNTHVHTGMKVDDINELLNVSPTTPVFSRPLIHRNLAAQISGGRPERGGYDLYEAVAFDITEGLPELDKETLQRGLEQGSAVLEYTIRDPNGAFPMAQLQVLRDARDGRGLQPIWYHTFSFQPAYREDISRELIRDQSSDVLDAGFGL